MKWLKWKFLLLAYFYFSSSMNAGQVLELIRFHCLSVIEKKTLCMNVTASVKLFKWLSVETCYIACSWFLTLTCCFSRNKGSECAASCTMMDCDDADPVIDTLFFAHLDWPAPVRLSSGSPSAWSWVLGGGPAPPLTLCRPEPDSPWRRKEGGNYVIIIIITITEYYNVVILLQLIIQTV